MEAFSPYYTCLGCKTTYHIPTISALQQVDMEEVATNPQIQTFTCMISKCPFKGEVKRLPKRTEPPLHEIVCGLQDLFADYVNLKKMMADISDLH